MGCKHHYVYTQGHFYCTKCGHRHYGSGTSRRSSIRRGNKAGIFIGILLVIVVGLIAVPIGMNYFGMPISLDILQPIISGGRNLEITLDEGFDLQEKEKTKPEQKETIPEAASPKPKEPVNFIEELTKSITLKPLNITDIEQKVHELINEERSKNGLTSLTLVPLISNIARQHSEDMASRDYFQHDTPEGKSFGDRYRENNFNCEVKISVTTYATGAENISYLEGYTGETRIAKVMVDGWMTSDGHRKNILTPYFKNEGIGIAKTGNKIYGTQNFC